MRTRTCRLKNLWRNSSRSGTRAAIPLFQVMMVLQNAADSMLNLPGITVERIVGRHGDGDVRSDCWSLKNGRKASPASWNTTRIFSTMPPLSG